MESAKKLREHYAFTEEDEQNLARLKPMMDAEYLIRISSDGLVQIP